MPIPKASLSSKPFGKLVAKKPGRTDILRNKATPPKFEGEDPKKLAPGSRLLEVSLNRKSKEDVTVEVQSAGFDAPVTVTIKAGETVGHASVSVKDLSGDYTATIVHNATPPTCTVSTTPFAFTVLCKLAFTEQPFDARNQDLGMGAKHKLRFELTTTPGVDLTVPIECPGFDPAKQTVTIPANHASKTFEHDVQLVDKAGEYELKIGKPTNCTLKDAKKDDAPPGPIKTSFKLGVKVAFHSKPFGEGQGDPAQFNPGDNVNLELRMTGTAAKTAKYKLTSTGLTGLGTPATPPAPGAAAWTIATTAVTTPGKYTVELAPDTGLEAKGKVSFEVRLLAGFAFTPFSVEPKKGAKAKLDFELSATSAKPVKLVLKCPGIDPKKQTITIPANARTHSVEVQMSQTPGGYVAELEAPSGVVIRDGRGRAAFRLRDDSPNAIPAVEFEKEPIAGGIKPFYDIGQVIPFMLKLSEDAHVGGSSIKLSSDAFDPKTVDRTIARGEGLEPIRFEVPVDEKLFDDNSLSDKKLDVDVLGDQRCTTGTNAKIQITISPPVSVEFAEEPVRPASEEGHYPGEKVMVRLSLGRAAPPGGATVVVWSDVFVHPQLNPNGTATAAFRGGEKAARVEVTLHAKDPKYANGGLTLVTIQETTNCRKLRHGKLQATIKIRPLPTIDFDATWIEPSPGPYAEGEHAKLFVKLSAPAPTNGARFRIASTALEEPIVAALLPGETTLKLDGLLLHADLNPQDVTITPEGEAPGCAAGTNATKQLTVEAGAVVQWETTWIEPNKTVYDEGDKIKLHVSLTKGAPVDAFARLDSPAFGKRAYIARFPVGKATQGGEVVNPEEDLPGKALKFVEDHPQVLKLAMPGMLAKIATRQYRVIPPPAVIEATIQTPTVPVGTPTPGQTVQQEIRVTGLRGCVGTAMRTIKVRAKTTAEPKKGVLPCGVSNDSHVEKIEYCNAHRLLIEEKHGGDRVAKRGHDGQGTWEVVASDAAPKLNVDAAVSPLTIQMIAGKMIYTKDDQPHVTEVTVRSDRTDHFCSYEVQHPEATATGRVNVDDTAVVHLKHPHLVVLQKQVRALETLIMTGGKPTKALETQMKMEIQQVPEHPGWVSYISKKPPKAGFDVRSNALGGLPLRTVKIKKRQQKYEKLAAKGVPLKFLDTGIGFINVTDIIKSAQTIFAPRIEHYRFLLETCGIPDGKRTKVGAPRLEARIDVYPSEEFCLFLDLTPMPAMQFGNDGRYVVEGALATGTGGQGDPNDPNRPANQTQLGGDLMDKATNPIREMGDGPMPLGGPSPTETVATTLDNLPGNVSPLENQKATESTTPNTTVISQMESRGGGVVQNTPELEVERRTGPEMGRKRGPLIQRTLPGLTTGKSHDRAKPSKSTEQRVLAPNPKTRVFHPIYAQGAFAPPTEMSELSGWTTAKVGLVVNGRPKPEFMKITQAIYAIIYAVRHFADFFKGLQDMVPSWGWGVTFDLGFLEGGLRFRWGWKEFEDWRVFRWWQAEANVVLFRASVEVWAGIKWRALFIKFQFVAYAKISGMLPAKFSVEREGPDGGVEWDAEVGAATTAEIGIRMILVHENFLYANASVKTGYYFKFIFKDPTERRMGIFWEAYFMGLSIGVTFKIVQYKKITQKEKVLIEGNPEGVPQRQGTLFPRGNTAERDAFRSRRALRHAWLRAMAEFGKLDEALSWWHDLQLVALGKRNAAEWEEDAEDGKPDNQKFEWPWTDDPDVHTTAFTGGVRMRLVESTLWKGQWKHFTDAVKDNRIKVVGDEEGKGKVQKTRKKMRAVPLLGKKLAKMGKVDLRRRLMELIESQEIAVEKVKQALANIEVKYIATLRELDREIALADDEDRPVRKEYHEQLDEAGKWGDWPYGKITEIVSDAMEDLELDEMQHYLEQLEEWSVGEGVKVPRP